ncbi:MAG TPA: hypothetical protein PK926_12685 [Spirochaetota bacterium]|nr:hypothetical protein [Spirochaetota bacterium]HPI91050.1 hypothetical protein [Spirochaetota bacterium]HPR49086.1 hypothetical protein [Spirochaetota bacterium]
MKRIVFIVLFIPLLLPAVPAVPDQGLSISIAPFFAAGPAAGVEKNIRDDLIAAFTAQGIAAVARDDLAEVITPETCSGKDDSALFKKGSIATTHLLAGDVIVHESAETSAAAEAVAPPDGAGVSCTVRLFLYSLDEGGFVYSTEEILRPEHFTKGAASLSGRVKLFLEGTLPVVADIALAECDTEKEVSLKWECSGDASAYEVFRSAFRNGPADLLGETDKKEFADTTGEPGAIYFYRVRPVAASVTGDLSAAVTAYKKISSPAGLDLDAVLKSKKEKDPVITDPAEKERVEKELAIASKYYVNLFSVNFILTVIRHYIRTNQVIVLENAAEYIVDRGRRTVYLVYPGKCVIRFFCNRLFVFYEECPPPDGALTISFRKDDDPGRYLASGWDSPGSKITWSRGNESCLTLPVSIGDQGSMIDLYLGAVIYNDQLECQRAVVSANDTLVGSFCARLRGRYSLFVPAQVRNGRDDISLRFYFPDATQPAEIFPDNKDTRVLALALDKLQVYPYDRERDLFRRIIDNSVVFALPLGKQIDVTLKTGESLSLPLYEGAGMASQYFRNSADWKKSTLIFGSSDKEIRRKMKEAQKKLKR